MVGTGSTTAGSSTGGGVLRSIIGGTGVDRWIAGCIGVRTVRSIRGEGVRNRVVLATAGGRVLTVTGAGVRNSIAGAGGIGAGVTSVLLPDKSITVMSLRLLLAFCAVGLLKVVAAVEDEEEDNCAVLCSLDLGGGIEDDDVGSGIIMTGSSPVRSINSSLLAILIKRSRLG